MIEHNPDHPYLRRLVGCGHGRLWAEPCPECEIAGLIDEYKRAVRTVARVRDRPMLPTAWMPAACPCPRTWRPGSRIVHATATRRRGFRLPGLARQNRAPERRSPART